MTNQKENPNSKAENAEVEVEGLSKFSKSIEKDIILMKSDEIRYLVDYYYQKQDDRKAKFNQIRAVEDGVDIGEEESNSALHWLAESSKNEENQIKKMLDIWTDSLPVGRWMKATIGIGPVIAAGLLSHFDIRKANHSARFISYAGLNDQNNPWLGSEKAKKLTKDIFINYSEVMDKLNLELTKFCENNDINMKKLTPIMKKLSAAFDYRDDLYNLLFISLSEGDSMSDIEELLDEKQISISEKFIELDKNLKIIKFFTDNNKLSMFADLCHYTNDDTIVTNWVIEQVIINTNRLHQTVINGLHGTIGSRKVKKKSKFYTKSDLEAYLAKPPYNKELKTLCWKIGDSFLKRSNHPNSLYGRLYKERKAYELIKNENGDYKDQAQKALLGKNWTNKEVKAVYESGKLPAGHIESRAKRWAVRIFICHVFEAMYIDYNHETPPVIYPLANKDIISKNSKDKMIRHADYIAPEIPYSDFINVPDQYYKNYPGVFK